MSKFDPVKDIPDLSGKIAIVTGGKFVCTNTSPPLADGKLHSRGMGYHIVQQLANHGAKVYMAARSEASAKQAISRIEAAKPELQGKKQVVYLHLDLSTLKSAQDAANEYLQLEQKIDIIGI